MSDGLRFGGYPRHHFMSDYWQSRYLLDRISLPGVGDESKCRYPWSVQMGVVAIHQGLDEPDGSASSLAESIRNESELGTADEMNSNQDCQR